jgi:hypothetical protein
MLFPSATVVAALMLCLAGASPVEARTAARGAAGSVAASTKVAAGLWAPKKSKPRAPRDDAADAREEDLLKSRAPAGGGDAAQPKTTRRRPIKMDDSAEEGEEEGAEEGDEEDEDRPKVVKKRRRVVEEEEEDTPEPIPSQPSVIPRIVNLGVGMAAMRRSFSFDQATQQGDKGVRLGYQIALESYPFVTQPSGAWRTIGLGAFYEKEYGDATSTSMTGAFTGYKFNQSRWGFDLRWAIPAGEWVVIIPALGYGRIGADLERMQPLQPCAATEMQPCFGDVKASYLSADVHIRIGVTPTFALSLSGGYLLGLGVAKGTDQITSEASATMRGFHVDPGAQILVGNWFAVQATIPIRRYSYSFEAPANPTFTYRSASDMYYGLIAGVAVLTK